MIQLKTSNITFFTLLILFNKVLNRINRNDIDNTQAPKFPVAEQEHQHANGMKMFNTLIENNKK